MTFWKHSKKNVKVAERVKVNPRLCKNAANAAYHDYTSEDGACTKLVDGDPLGYLLEFGLFSDICQDKWWASENVTVSGDVHKGFKKFLDASKKQNMASSCNIDCMYVAACSPAYTLFVDTPDKCRTVASANKVAVSIGEPYLTDDGVEEYSCIFTPDTSRQDANLETLFNQFEKINFVKAVQHTANPE